MNNYTTGEVSKKLNISERSLRYYDQINLINPSFKNEYGTRYYNDVDILNIEKIILLKTLNLPLHSIKKVLSEITIEQILNAQINSLKKKIKTLESSLSHSHALLNILKVEGDLKWEQLIPLTKNEKNDEDKKKKLDQYFDEEEQMIIQTHLPKMEHNDQQISKWIHLIRRVEICLERNTYPDSEEGQIIAADALILSKEVFGANQELEEKFWNIRKSSEESKSLNLYPIREEVIIFLEEAVNIFTG